MNMLQISPLSSSLSFTENEHRKLGKSRHVSSYPDKILDKLFSAKKV